MSRVFKPRAIEYRLPTGEKVPKGTPGAARVERESPWWWGEYGQDPRTKRPFRKRLSRSLETARRMLRNLERDWQLRSSSRADRYEAHLKRPLLEHLADYAAYLRAEGDVEEYVGPAVARARAVIEGCRFATIEDVTEAAVSVFLAGLRQTAEVPALTQDAYTTQEAARLLGITESGVLRLCRRGRLPACGRAPGSGPRKLFARADLARLLGERARGIGAVTSNHYLTAMKGFTRWLVRTAKRVPEDPLEYAGGLNEDLDRRHPRRALAADQFAAFVDATAGGPPWRGLAGRDRLVLYTLAANTGFRAGELAVLAPESFDLGADPPAVVLTAAQTKNRKGARQPLRPDVAEVLRGYLAGREAGNPVWPGTWSDEAAEMVRRDLAAAGLPYQEGGRYFDFHAIRGQFLSMLAAGGVHPRVAQALARHSTIELTMGRYTDAGVLDKVKALERLPGVVRPPTPPAGE